jgi:hypothetical protein
LDARLLLSYTNLVETSQRNETQPKGLGAVCVLKIQRSANGQVIFKLSGRIEADEVGELQELLALETAGRELVLDLKDVTLVNQDAVTFLDGCEANHIKLENCPAYIRAWIDRGKGRRNRRRE